MKNIEKYKYNIKFLFCPTKKTKQEIANHKYYVEFNMVLLGKKKQRNLVFSCCKKEKKNHKNKKKEKNKKFTNLILSFYKYHYH